MSHKGMLEVICGSMFSGKSEELIRRMRRAKFAKKHVLVFKHSLDKRKTTKQVVSHNGTSFHAYALNDPRDMLSLIPNGIDIVGVDEVQFFSHDIVPVILELVARGIRVVATGLDLDFRGIPFGPMPALMALADKTTKLKAICVTCGEDAHYSQRIINGNPAKFNDPVIKVGAEECYQARCRNCFVIDQQPQQYYGQV